MIDYDKILNEMVQSFEHEKIELSGTLIKKLNAIGFAVTQTYVENGKIYVLHIENFKK